MTAVKICGLRRVEDAIVAAETGADLLGLVFAPSRRRVDAGTAQSIVEGVRPRSQTKMVGVFVNASAGEMNRVARQCDLDYVQLCGDEPDEIMGALDVPAIRVIHVPARCEPGGLAARIMASPAHLVLLDTDEAGSHGGSGKTFDWGRLPPIDRPILLAGGLHAGNVGAAIAAARPWGVDVSSGVESGGAKDQAKIRRFICAARRSHHNLR